MFKIATLLPLLLVVSAHAEERRVETVAGDLLIRKSEGSSECTVDIAGTVVARIDCEGAYLPNVLANFQNVGSLRQVLVLQETPTGNACNGGPVRVISITGDLKASASRPLDFCGGPNPQIVRRANGVLITFPGGPPNRGSGRLPTERWRFSERKLEKLRWPAV
jgi:hypothetical protein